MRGSFQTAAGVPNSTIPSTTTAERQLARAGPGAAHATTSNSATTDDTLMHVLRTASQSITSLLSYRFGSMDRIRASDTERERVVSMLREAAIAGRLTVEELDARSERAYGAVTRGELAALLED
jgi:hypothetical protein